MFLFEDEEGQDPILDNLDNNDSENNIKLNSLEEKKLNDLFNGGAEEESEDEKPNKKPNFFSFDEESQEKEDEFEPPEKNELFLKAT